MEFRLSDKILLLKIRLAYVTEKLTDYGQVNFAGYIQTNVSQLYLRLDELKDSGSVEEVEEKMQAVISYLDEMENIFMACKVGVRLPMEENVLGALRDIKTELKELIRRQMFSKQITN
jgi:hypothetical protein